MTRPVVLVGLMGSGKTSVGTRLAQALGRPFRDSDGDLERQYGQSAAEQFQRYGAGVLHDREAAMLRDALAAPPPPPVIAAAASVVDDPGCRAALAGAYVVWLDAPPPVLAGRIPPQAPDPGVAGEGAADHRPRYDADPEVMLTRQYERRAPRFRSVADLRVDVARELPEIVAAVLAGLSRDAGPGGRR